MGFTLEGLLALAAATAIGSFLGTIGMRLAADFRRGGGGGSLRYLLSGRSVCACAARRLSLTELAPILSFVLAQGRCRRCAAGLPRMEPSIELAAFLAALLALSIGAGGVDAVLFAAAAACSLALAWIDFDQGFLPDVLLSILAGVGLIVAALSDPVGVAWSDRLIGASVGGGALFGLRWAWLNWRGVDALGWGDVKLAMVAGFWVGASELPALIAIGAGATLALAVAQHGFSPRASAPLGPGLLSAMMGFLLWRMVQA